MAAGRCYLFNSYRSAWNAGFSLISFIKRISTAAEPYFVDFRDVWLEYNEELLRANHFAVEAIDLKVGRGEFIPIVGPSGCGKPTFMKLTTGLRMPSMGKILIDGQPVTGPLKISGTAFQAPSLLPWRTTVDNVLLPLEIVEPFRSNFKQKKKEYVERVRTLLQKVGVLLGFVIGSSRLAYVAMYPLMTAFNALPKAAFVPILVVWFGIGIGVGLAFAGLLVVGAIAMAMYELFSIIEKRTTGCGSPARCRKSPTRWSRCTAASGTGPMGEGRNAAGAALPPPGVPAPSWPCQTCGMHALIALALVSSSLLLAACSSGPPTRAARPPVYRELTPQESSNIAIHALGLVGTPSRYGGNTPQGGFDCSGLIGYVYRSQAGVAPPRTVAQLDGFGEPVDARSVRTGDLVIFGSGRPNHAGIYVGEGRFVHAPSSGGEVRLDRLDSRYWARQSVTFRRP